MVAKRLLVFVLSIVLLSLSCISYASAFSTESGGDINLCAGTTATIIDSVTGAGSYRIGSSGSASSFSTTIPSGLMVSSSNNVYSYISPPSLTSPGPYELDVSIADQNGEVKVINHKVNVNDCHKADLSVDSNKLSCSCEETIFLLTLKNSGDYLESYEVFAEGNAKDWTTLSESVVILGAKEEKTVKAYVKAPCNVFGSYDITFKSKAALSLSIATAKANLEIKPCYDYSLNTEKNYYSTCENSVLNIPVTIDNTGTSDNSFSLKIDSPNWINLEKSSMALASLQEGSVNIIASPAYQIKGNFTISINSVSEKGQVKKSNVVKVNVEKCYDVFTDIIKQKDRMCSAVSSKYEIRVKNTGKYSSTYSLKINGVEWAKLSQDSISLSADEEKTVLLEINPPYNTEPKTYSIDVEATDGISKTSSSDSIEIEIATLENCYQPVINAKQKSIELNNDDTTTDLIILENKGTETATYIIDLSGTASKFAEINPGIISIEPGKAEIVYLYVAPGILTNSGDYDATITARLKDTTVLSSSTVSIKVNKGEAVEQLPSEIKTEEITEPKAAKESVFFRLGRVASNIGTSIKGFFTSVGNGFSDIYNSLKPTPYQMPENVTVGDVKQMFLNGDVSQKNVNAYFMQQNMSEEASNILLEKWKGEIKENEETVENITLENATITGATVVEPITEPVAEVVNETVETVNESLITEQIVEEQLTEQEEPETVIEELTNQTNTEVESNLTLENQSQAPEKVKINLDFSAYKKYILGAVIIIIIMLLFITGFWRKIIDFFEEEVEEPRKNSKK